MSVSWHKSVYLTGLVLLLHFRDTSFSSYNNFSFPFQGTSLINVLDSVVEALIRNPDRKFVFAEQVNSNSVAY